METTSSTADRSEKLRGWVGRRIANLDRGWKATLLGVGLVLVIALVL